MAKKITDLPELAEAPNANDLFEIVDVSTGTSKRIKAQYLGGGSSTTPTFNDVLTEDNTTDLTAIFEDTYNKTVVLTEGVTTELIGEYKNSLNYTGFIFEDLTTLKLTNLQYNLPTGNGMIYIPDVVDETETLALISDIPTNTSDLINDGDDGNPFISLLDLPSNIIFYPTNVASDISGYVKIVTSITDPSYNTTAVDVSTGAITTTNQLVSSLATATNIIVGNPGVFNITTIGNVRRISGSGTASFYFKVYKRTSAGVETLVATSDNTIPVLDGGTYIEFSSTAIWDDGIFLDTDRVVMKYYANRIAGGSNPTYEFQFGGITPVRTLVPIPLSVVPILTIDAVPTDGSTNAVSSNGVFNALALKVDKTSWVDYSATSTVVGWSSFTDKFIYYKIIGDYVFVNFRLGGTSNSTSTSFTLPFNSTSGFEVSSPSAVTINNSVASVNSARITITSGTPNVNILRDLTGTTWSASGTKIILGIISFKIN